MSERENVRKLEGKERSVDFVKKVSSAKLETIKSETCIRPRFANHTLSSLMKRRTPINSRKKSSTMSTRASKKSQKSLVYNRPSGIYKRHSITKQNKSMQALMTILKWEKADYRASVSRQDSELTGTVCECTENTLVFLSSDLIKDVSRNLKKFAASPAKSVISRGEPTKVVNQPEKRVEDSHAHLEEKMKRTDLSPCLQDNTEENIRDNMKENCTTIDIARQSQPSDVEKKLANSHREIKVLHRRPKPNKPEERLAEDFSNKDCSAIETQIYRQNGPANVNDATTDNRKYAFRRGNRKTWAIRKAEIKHVNDERTYNVNLQSSRNSKFVRHVNNSRDKDDRSVVNCAVSIQNKGTFQKNLVFHNNQRVWRPPGVTRPSVIKSTMSLTQPTSQKSSKSTKRAIASMKNKYSSIEHTEMLNSEPTNASTSVNQSKMVMKENRDPRANRITKICEHFAEAKQQQRLQSGGTLSKKRHPTKGDSNTSNNHNNANPTRSRPTSRSRHWQTIKPREYSRNWNEQNRTESAVIYNKRSKPSEVIHTLKEIINGVKIDEDVEKNAVNMSNYDVFNNKESDSGLQALSNRDISAKMSQNDKTNFIKNKHFDEPNRSFNQSVQKSISTQKEERPDSTESLKLTQIATQSSSYNNNIVKVGCNTTHYNIICRDAEVSCALISSTNSKADIDSTAIGDKTMTLEDVPVHAESIMHAESNAEDEYFDKSKKLPISECKRTLSTEMTLELEDYDIMDTPAKPTSNFIRDEKIINGNSQALLKLLENFDDKTMTLEDVPVHAESIMHAESNAEDEYFDKSKKLPISECKRTLSTEMTLELEDYDIMDTPAKPISNFIRDEKIIDGNSQALLKLLESFDDKTMTLEDVPVHAKSIMHAESNAENEYFDKSKKLPISECKRTLSAEMTLELEDYDIMDTPAKASNNFIRDDEKIIDGNSQALLKLLESFDDKTMTLEDVPVHAKSIMHAESNAEDEYFDKSKKLPISECKRTLSTEMTLELEDYDIMDTPAKPTSNFIRDKEKIIDENSQTLLKLLENFDDKPNIVINRPQTFDRDNVNYIWQYLFTERYPLPSSSIYNYNYPWTDEEIAKCYGIESEHEDMSSCSSEEVMSESNVKNIPSDVTAASELAGECASFYKAGELYKFINYENLSFPKPEEIKNRDEETIEDYEIVEKGGSCVNCEIVNRSRSKCDAKCCCFDMANAEDNDGFSTCSSRSSNSVQMCECDISLYKLPISKYYQLVKQKKIKSLSELMVQGMIEKEYKFKVLQLVDDMKEYKGLQLIEDENNDETAGAVKTLALPTTAEKTFSIISLENLLSLIYFILSFIVFWYLEVWFQFDPAT
ncbi:uncharacterized protein [Anoplolepis gracilipes]|uniref:uncharacterized protein n=1 Tax=Anoplolepis gracilipes TaxID=354296 RepID=UPI003B9EA61F